MWARTVVLIFSRSRAMAVEKGRRMALKPSFCRKPSTCLYDTFHRPWGMRASAIAIRRSHKERQTVHAFEKLLED